MSNEMEEMLPDEISDISMSGSELEKLCAFASYKAVTPCSAYRDSILLCRNENVAVSNDYIESGCVATHLYPTGHSRLDAYINPEDMLKCPYRQEKK